MRDEFPKFEEPPSKMFSGVINLDDSKGRGTHWVAFVVDPKLPFGEYFDSFGMPPSLETIKMFMKFGKMPLSNNVQYQPTVSDLCGYYAAYYISMRDEGHHMYDVISTFNLDPMKNDKLVTDYFLEEKKGGYSYEYYRRKRKIKKQRMTEKRKFIKDRIALINDLIKKYGIQ